MSKVVDLHDVLRKKFMKFLVRQDQLRVAKDLLPDLMYTFQQSPDGFHNGSATLRAIDKIKLVCPKNCDAILNLEIRAPGVKSATYVKVLFHQSSHKDLKTGWITEKEARVAELADARDLGSRAERHAGSTPVSRIRKRGL